tara:strand:+ start:727 stop:891 length:165 start_codon:yes stop_codon:yes gene_type:complete
MENTKEKRKDRTLYLSQYTWDKLQLMAMMGCKAEVISRASRSQMLEYVVEKATV